MADICGKYQHQSNENLEEYYKTIGVPFIPRKMMMSSSPLLEISTDEKGEWTISTSTFLRTTVIKFILGVEYEEHMPGGITIKSTTTKDNNTINTVSISPNGTKVIRSYTFSDKDCVLHLQHEESGIEAKRFFNRV